MKKGLFIFITTFGRAWFAWFGGWRRNGAMAWPPPPSFYEGKFDKFRLVEFDI